jgi:hypothetical protein
VLDLRRNLGGYTDAMVAGINPLLGDAPGQPHAARLLRRRGPRQRARALLRRRAAARGLYDPRATSQVTYVKVTTALHAAGARAAPSRCSSAPPPASASEAITLGFRGGPVPNRSFGEPTYGLTTGPYGTYLPPDDGFLNVTATIMFDRTGRLYGGKLQPDEPVVTAPNAFKYHQLTPTPDPADPVVAAAAAWLRRQPACGGAPAAAGRSEAALSREPGAAALPGVVRELPAAARRPRVMAVPAEYVAGRP